MMANAFSYWQKSTLFLMLTLIGCAVDLYAAHKLFIPLVKYEPDSRLPQPNSKPSEWAAALTKHPGVVLLHAQDMKERFNDEVGTWHAALKGLGKPETEIKVEAWAFAKKQEEKIGHLNPIFLLDECGHWDGCKLERSKASFRKQFEDHAATLLKSNKNGANKLPTRLVDFASGDLFQLLMVISKHLEQQPDSYVSVDVIDHKYTLLALLHYFAQKPLSPDGPVKLDRPAARKALREAVRKSDVWYDRSWSDEALDDELSHRADNAWLPFKQLLRFVKLAFPKSKVEVWPYSTARQYCFAREIRKENGVDVLMAADIPSLSNASAQDTAPRDFILLRKRLAVENPSLVGLWLQHEHENSDEKATLEKFGPAEVIAEQHSTQTAEPIVGTELKKVSLVLNA